MHNIIRNNYTPRIGDYHNTIVHDNELNRVWFFDCDGVFESKTNIAVRNEGGESTTDAISQKFVTDNLGSIDEDISDLEVGKQDKLVSGTTIKTINNQSILGSGNISIEGTGDDYENLDNLPKVNNVTLVGNKTSADLGLQSALTAGDNITIENNVISATGGGTPIEAGKGIEVEEYAPLSITMEVTGELPPDFEDILPVSISLTNVKPGTNMYDLYLEGVLADGQAFFWDIMYNITTSGIDSDVISIVETSNDYYVIQFNGAGTTTGTITATRGTESYTTNVTATITAGDNTSYVSEGKHMIPASLLMAFLELSYGDVVDDPEELLELFENQDNVDSFIAAIKKRYKFYASADGISINFQTLMYDEYGIVLLMQSGGDFDSAIISIRFEDGEAVSLSKNAIISTFTEDSDGLVPKPGSSQTTSKFLKGDGTWQTLNTYALTLTLEDDTTVTLNLKGE